MWIQRAWSPNSTLSNRSTRFFLDSLFQLCVILFVGHSEIQETLNPITAFGRGQGEEMQSFFCSCASCRARNTKPSVGPFPSFPLQMRLKEVQLMKQLSYDQECNGSNQARGWGMVAMTLQSMHHAFHLWVVLFWLMTSCLSFHVSKCDNNIKQLRVAPTHCFSTDLEMLF